MTSHHTSYLDAVNALQEAAAAHSRDVAKQLDRIAVQAVTEFEGRPVTLEEFLQRATKDTFANGAFVLYWDSTPILRVQVDLPEPDLTANVLHAPRITVTRFADFQKQQQAEIAHVAANFDYSIFAGAKGRLSGTDSGPATQLVDVQCEDLNDIMAWTVRRALDEPGLVVFVAPAYHHVRNIMAEMADLFHLLGIRVRASTMENRITLETHGGSIKFYTFADEHRLYGPEFSDAAIYGRTLAPAQASDWVAPRMMTRLRRRKANGEPNMVAYAY